MMAGLATRVRHLLAPMASMGACLLAVSLSSPPAFGQSPSIADTKTDKEPIKIGFLVAIDSPLGFRNKEMLNGMNLYLDKIGGKMGGRKVELLVADTSTKPSLAVLDFKKLVEKDGVSLIGGIYYPPIALALVPEADKYQIPVVIAAGSDDDVTQRKRSPWVIRTSNTSSQPCFPLGDYAFRKLGYKRLILAAVDFSFGHLSAGGFQSAFEAAGGKIIQKILIPNDPKTAIASFVPPISKNADAIMFASNGLVDGKFMSEVAKQGLDYRVLGTNAGLTEVALGQVGKGYDGAIFSVQYSHLIPTAANKKFKAEYEAKFGKILHPDLLFDAERGYVNGMWMDRAITSLRGDVSDKAKLMEALKKVVLKDAPRGPIKLDAYGQVVENYYLVKTTWKDGAYKEEITATYPNVSQFWKWTPEEYLSRPVFARNYPPCSNCELPSN